MKKNVIIIAEAGVNHNGNYDNAIKLIQLAANAGADYIKFQTFKADKLVTKEANLAEYQKKNGENSENNQYEMLKKLELPLEWYPNLINYSHSLGIKFLSTGFDEESIDFLESLNIDLYKIPSGELTNRPLIEHIAKKGKPVILSTGMSYMFEIKAALEVIEKSGISRRDITILHCNTEYPTPFENVNLLAMQAIKSEFNINIGYSDHTLGIEVPIAAVALGAMVIEKHFTLDKNLPGPDHKASLDPNELKSMVSAIRNIELSLIGEGIKEPSLSEKKNIVVARKSIHIIKGLKKGDVISVADLAMMRPGDGISPMEISKIIGKKVNKNLNPGHKLTYNDILF
jgi:N,N'-diacetyllegionaminate synthase